jgi:tetratricopeptide (TPR) repeat protein
LDKAKIFAAAEKAIVKGQYDKALEQFEALLRMDPQDAKILNRVADLYLKKGDNKKGIDSLHKLADCYTKDGFYSKAVAIYKRILKIDNGDSKDNMVSVYEKLADLYGQLGLISDAMAQYAVVVDVYDRMGEQQALLNVLKKVSDLDPYNIDSQLKLAELFLADQRVEDAQDALGRLSENIIAKGHMPDILRVYERWVELFPADVQRLKELVDRYLQVSEPKKALARIQVAFKADPHSPDILELLASTFRQLNQPEKAKAVEVELIKIYRKAGNLESAQAVEHRVRGEIPTFEKEEAQMPVKLRASSVDDIDPAESLIQSLPLEPDEKKIISECDVYLKYGLNDKAFEVLTQSLQKHSQSLALRWKLKGAALEKGLHDQAAHLLSEIKMLAQEKKITSWVQLADEELSRLQPGSAPSDLSRDDAVMDELEFVEDSEVSIVLDEEDIPSEPEASLQLEAAQEPEAPFELEMKAEEIAPIEEESSVLDLSDDAEPTPLLTEDDFSEAELQQLQNSLMPEETLSPSTLEASEHLEMNSEEVMTFSAQEESKTDLSQSNLAVDSDFEVKQALEEIDFFKQQGLEAEARSALKDLLERYPAHPLIQAHGLQAGINASAMKKTDKEVEALGRKVKLSVQEDERTEDTGGFFDLASELASELEADEAPEPVFEGPAEVREVFNAFKSGVAQAVSADDWQTHFDLGIAYREMGLFEDALQEFKIVSQQPKQESSAFYQMGICEMSRQRLAEAKIYFDKALQVPDLMQQEKISITYELAEVLLQMNQSAEAKKLFEAVRSLDPEFRDVQEKLGQFA